MAIDNDLGGATNGASNFTLTAALIPYKYTLLGSALVVTTVPMEAGAVLTFDGAPATNGTTLPHFMRRGRLLSTKG